MNSDLLKKIIKERCVNKSALAEKLGVSRVSTYHYINGVCEPRATQISVFADVLRLTDDEVNRIFFAKNVECDSTLKEEA